MNRSGGGPGAATRPRQEAGPNLPIALPSKVVCVGLNYRDHATEAGLEAPRTPLLFAKWPNALIGPHDEILVPREVRTDYEAELAVVIGRRARGVLREEALACVAGYLCANDITARDHQFQDGQWVRAKSLDTFCPIGPALVPREQVPDPQDLRIRLSLNGALMQDSSTAQMIFGVADIISFVSRTATLEPGDLILTGTPAGVGVFRNPPVGLKEGDEINGVNIRPCGGGRLMIWSGQVDAEIQEQERASGTWCQRPAELATAALQAAQEYLPALASAQVETARICRRALPRDGLPVMGWVPGVAGLYVIAAHAAVTLAPALAELSVTEVSQMTRAAALDGFRPDRFARADKPAAAAVHPHQPGLLPG